MDTFCNWNTSFHAWTMPFIGHLTHLFCKYSVCFLFTTRRYTPFSFVRFYLFFTQLNFYSMCIFQNISNMNKIYTWYSNKKMFKWFFFIPEVFSSFIWVLFFSDVLWMNLNHPMDAFWLLFWIIQYKPLRTVSFYRWFWF